MTAAPRHARRALLVLLLGALALTLLVISPFWKGLFVAAVLTAAFRRWMEWLTRRLGGRRLIAAALLVVLAVLAVVLPVAGVATVLVREALSGIAWVRGVLESEGVAGLLGRLPGPVEDAVRRILEGFPEPQQQLQRLAGARTAQAAGALASLLSATTGAAFQTVMMLIALFFFLTDGDRLLDWLDRHVPLPRGRFRELAHEFRRTSVSVLWATIATSGIQAATGTVGYLVAGAPNVAFLALGTFVVSLIPGIGGAAIVVAVGLLMVASGHLLAGLFLVVWGLAVVSLVDNVARPYLLKGGMELHGGVVFFSLLGGIAVFGGIGLILGPLSFTFLLSVLSMYEREYGTADGAPEPS
ncbi:MAG TPA: AI-2E family transporter [Anaeromyxobacter sp.]|jgi:predicted PurR-regulated permease PerM|nr:AI-2E family transporter [Anaeromyxobacter sp.]